MQFLLDPEAISDILEMWNLFGNPFIEHVYYLTRTYVYYLYRDKQLLLGFWSSNTKYSKKNRKAAISNNPSLFSGPCEAGHQPQQYHHHDQPVVAHELVYLPHNMSDPTSTVQYPFALPVRSGNHALHLATEHSSLLFGRDNLGCFDGGVGDGVLAVHQEPN